MPVSDLPLTQLPTEYSKAIVPSRILKAAGQRLKMTTDKQVRRAEQKLDALVKQTLGKAADTLKKTAAAGPKTADHLNRKVSVAEMSMDDLEAASRVYERLIDVSRRQLGLDREEAVKPSIQVNVLAAIGSIGDTAIDAGPVIEIPAKSGETSEIADPIGGDI